MLNITKGFLAAFCLSLFIYLKYFGLENIIVLKLINTLNAIVGFYILLSSCRKTLFWSGVFIGLFWFYWIGLSFRYYNLSYLIPLMVLFVSLGYGLIFWVIGFFIHPILKAIIFLFLSYFHPLGFNWFIPELIFLDSFIGISKWQFGLFLLAISLWIVLKKWYKLIAIVFLILSIEYQTKTPPPMPKQKIYIQKPNIPQDQKWQPNYLPTIIEYNFNTIEDAILKGYDIVILSESVFPLFLNQEELLIKKLKELSNKIVIVTGALNYQDSNIYNSTYYFINSEVKIANKVVLVPFGEDIPLPEFLTKFINKIFFNSAEDYSTASSPSDININGEVFRNAICYEATHKRLYEKKPNYMIAISNNAWFSPSIEPTLQNLLLRFYSKKYNTIIFHSANSGKSGVIIH